VPAPGAGQSPAPRPPALRSPAIAPASRVRDQAPCPPPTPHRFGPGCRRGRAAGERRGGCWCSAGWGCSGRSAPAPQGCRRAPARAKRWQPLRRGRPAEGLARAPTPAPPTAAGAGGPEPRAHLDVAHEQLGGRLDGRFAVDDLLHGAHPAHGLAQALRVEAVAMLPAKHRHAPVACEGQTAHPPPTTARAPRTPAPGLSAAPLRATEACWGWEGDAKAQPGEGRGHPTRLLVGLPVRPEHGAEAGEHEGAQPPGPLLAAAIVVQGVGRQHEPVLPRPDPGGLHATPHLPLQPAWEGQSSAPAAGTVSPAGSPARGRVCPLPASPARTPCPSGTGPSHRRGTMPPAPAAPRLLRRQRPPCPSLAVPTFHQSVGVILHRPRALLHDEAAHLLRDEQGPGDDTGLSPGARGSLPQPLSGELALGAGVSRVLRGSGHPATPRWERGRAIGCR